MSRWIILLLVLGAAGTAVADGIPDLWGHTTAGFLNYEGEGPLFLLVSPDGTGPAFTDAVDDVGHGPVDASLTMTLRDGAGFEIALFPSEDMWLGSEDGGLAACIGGTNADQSTDVNGVTFWTAPLLAGGYSDAPARIYVNGNAFPEDFPLHFVSPDITGDGQVNLYDLTYFTQDYFAGYTFRSDLAHDGEINLVDLTRFAGAWGVTCP